MTLCDDLEKKIEKSQKEFEKILESAVQGILKAQNQPQINMIHTDKE